MPVSNNFTMGQKNKRGQPLPFQTPGEEIANAILHGIGALLAIAGLVLLVIRGTGGLGRGERDVWLIVSGAVYGASMFLMFIASTLYHALSHEGAKRVFRVLDHGAIYFLIAGTYTPFCLVALKGGWGWGLFAFEWALAITGISLYAVGLKALKKVELVVYILMGWAIVVGFKPLSGAVKKISIIFLILGGILYTLGTIWYRLICKAGDPCHLACFCLSGGHSPLVCHLFSLNRPNFKAVLEYPFA